MPRLFTCSLFAILVGSLAGARCSAAESSNAPLPDDVIWDSPSENSHGSMPLGNGDVALNVWVEKSGDLVFYIAKSDAYSENNQLLKLGRVRVTLRPNPFEGAIGFRQGLQTARGLFTVVSLNKDQAIRIQVWVDANRPVIHVDTESGKPIDLEAHLELWRTGRRTVDPKSPEMFGHAGLRDGPPVVIDPDTVLPARENRITWYHRNERSIYPAVLHVEHLDPLLAKYADPLLRRTFGACMSGPGLVAADDHTLRSEKPAKQQHLSITVLTAQTQTPEQWESKLNDLVAESSKIDPTSAMREAGRWWSDFWDRSWIRVTGSKEADAVSQGYAMQRFMMAAGGRGNLPAKFNGGLFTVDGRYNGVDVNPDFRAWGGSYWFQNNRHLYWPAVMAGDDDLLATFFAIYLNALPLAKDRTQLYWHHGGAGFQETIDFWGLPNPNDFGWDNPGPETKNTYIRRYWSGGLELTTMMLDRYDFTQERDVARASLVPLADAITTFYDEHWKRDESGRIRFEPAQSLETWQTAVNPLPEIAGLRYLLPRLLALPQDLTTDAQRARWRRTLADLPPIPVGPGTHGRPNLLPAQKVTRPSNVENPEEYAIFPYRLYGIGLPDLHLAIDTFEDRRIKGSTCWAWDVIVAARLGLADEAQRLVTQNFTAYGDQRFHWFWRPGHDWIPDLDNGGAGSTALQRMLMQCEGRQIRLLPAWPKDWDAEFKLHAPYRTTVEAKVHDGKIVELKVTPEERRKDVVIGSQQ